ncbi:uncharacterized protein C20orf194 homolog isoform X1 [Takifugu flavidus]|uniref:uncharacterized protein C20orf194 homolog isoform X1 n=1 Tax=Takifugu flavidus TaxID=433684 RepID=UPI002544609A|nr:uncharacterized protein C20orf194 homolog isoform X1 [Takifugu flavidus]
MAGMRRVNGKVSGVNPAVSCCRLRQVQALLRDGPASTDGILCSLGIDSRYNEGCTELAKYLFYGLYGRNPPSVEHVLEEFPEDLLDDVILLIKAQCVHLYCNPVNYGYLLPYVSHWRNLHLYCMTEAEYEDEEAAEEFKISSFLTMVQDCSRIGVPYSSQGHMQTFDMFMVEKWPLIQAFALDGIGRGSFFTMKYKLMDVSEKLWQVYNRLDPVSLNQVITEDLACFEKQWSCFFSSMDLESHLSILELSEAQAGEPFRTYYTHGLSSSNIPDKSQGRQPFVLFGKHSSSEDLENYSFNFASESHQVRSTGPGGRPATHMILQCAAPRAPLSCSRTYFFGTTHSPYLGNQNAEQKNTDVLLLSQIYSAAVQAVLSGIKRFSSTASLAKAKDVAENTFVMTLAALDLSRYCSSLRSRCDFTIQAVNNQGRILPLTDAESRFAIKTASVTVRDIPDLQRGGQDLGSVVFSESFLESSINIQQKDGSVSTDGCSTILTTTVPPYACWLMEADVKQSQQAQLLIKEEGSRCLGAVLTDADAAYLSCSSHLSTHEEGKIVFFSEGLLFIHSQYGSITLGKSHIRTIRFCSPDSGGVASLFVEYESSLLPHLPFPLHTSDQCLVFALQPRSKSHRTFFSKVLSVWENAESGLNLQMLDQEQLSWSQRNIHARLQKLHDSQEPPVAKRRGSLKTSYSQLPEQDMFLQHFALSSVSQEVILHGHLGALFPSAELSGPANRERDKIIINIITGLPGSHKEQLCRFLIQSKEKSERLALYPPHPRSPCSFSASHLQQFLTDFLKSRREAGGRSRLLVLPPGYTDVLDVVQALLSHPDPSVPACFTIGAVTACVEPLASFMEHRFAFPKLLEQCSQGVVSTLVFTGPAAEQELPLAQHLQQLLRSSNPTAAFTRAERGAVTRNEDVALILSDSSFSEPQMLRARYVLYPGWCRGCFPTGSGSLGLVQLCLTFRRPLERPQFVARCKAWRSALSPSPFRGNVYNVWGKVRFSDSEQLMEVSYSTIRGSLNVTPDQNQPLNLGPKDSSSSCFLVFDGLDLTEDGLKDWLRLCAKQTQEKPERTKKNLSPQEVEHIRVKRRLDPLPAGFSYDGRQYVDVFGDKRSLHPSILPHGSERFCRAPPDAAVVSLTPLARADMDAFIAEYVAEANREVELFNRQLELRGQPDLFDP